MSPGDWGEGGHLGSTPVPRENPAAGPDPCQKISEATSPGAVVRALESYGTSLRTEDICSGLGQLAAMQAAKSVEPERLLKAQDKMSQLASQNTAGLTGQGLANVATLTGVAYEPATTQPMMDALVKEVAHRLETPGIEPSKQLMPQQLSEIIYACAHSRHHPGEGLLNAFLKAVRLPELSLQGLIRTGWSLAQLGHLPAAQLLEGILALIVAKGAKQVMPKDSASLFWAAAVLSVASSGALQALRMLAGPLRPEELDRDVLARLFQAHMALSRLAAAAGAGAAAASSSNNAPGPGGPASGEDAAVAPASLQQQPPPLLPGDVLAQAEAAWRCQLSNSSQTPAQLEASKVLLELGMSHATAVITNGGLLKPDVVVITASGRLALSLDAASQFSLNIPYRPLGDAILRWRLLVLHDWQVLSIPFYKWESMKSGEDKKSYLQQLLGAQMPGLSEGEERAQPVATRSTSASFPCVGLPSQAASASASSSAEVARPAQPLKSGASAMRQRSLSADMLRTHLEVHGRAGSSGAAPLPSAGAPGLPGADPAATMVQLLASQQALQEQQLQAMWLQAQNPFRQQGPSSSASAPLLQQRGSGQLQLPPGLTANLSDPGTARAALKAHVGGGGGGRGLPRVASGSRPSTSMSEQSTALTSGVCASDRSGSADSVSALRSGLAAAAEGGSGSALSALVSSESSGSASSVLSGQQQLNVHEAGFDAGGPATTIADAMGGQEPLRDMQDIAARLAAMNVRQHPVLASLAPPAALLPQQHTGGLPPGMMLSPAAAVEVGVPPGGGQLQHVMHHPAMQGPRFSPYAPPNLALDEQYLAPGLPSGSFASSPLASMVGPQMGGLGGTPSGSALPLNLHQQQQQQQQQVLMQMQMLKPGAATNSVSSMGDADLRQLWQAVTRVEPSQTGGQEAANAAELKRIIEGLPLETSAVAAVEWRLVQLEPPSFAALLMELARDNHAFRAWQLFDWVRNLPEGHHLQRLCDANTYTTMITLCGPWQQLRRALQLVAEMRARSLECGIQAYSALLHAAVKCGETDLAVDVYEQMGREGMPRDRSIYVTMIEMFVKLGRVSDALSALADLHALGDPPDTHLYNLVLVAATKVGPPRFVLTVYHRMVADGATPNTKTFTALIGSFGKMGSVAAALEIIGELLSHEPGGVGSAATYAALMAACEKAGQGELALALFDEMCSQSVKPDVGIFNSMIAACAHGGEYNKARLMFESMAEHACEPDAVTYANLIRAFKKGGQWCAALDTFEAMLRSGCRPHAAVYSSIIDALWQTGISWAQARALQLFTTAVEKGSLPAAAESCKKGTLKLDLQSLTVGVAVVSMGAWLLKTRNALLQDSSSSPMDAARKLAVVNGLGEHSRAQGHSAAVKEAVGASLLGCKAPFRLVQDHSRSGRLEASILALHKWLFSENFDRYLSLVQPAATGEPLQSTSDYLPHEIAEKGRAHELWQRIVKYEATHPISLKVLHTNPGGYLQQRKALVALVLRYASALRLAQEVAHRAVALMDLVMMSGVHMTEQFHTLFICACLRLASLQEQSAIPTGLAMATLTEFPEMALERMEANITAVLRQDMECIAAVHCLKVYCQRLGCDLADGAAVRRAAGCAFALATEALSDVAVLQFPPSLTAAAILVAARRAQGSVPFWPSVLSQLTGFTEASSAPFASAIAHAGRLCSKLYTSADSAAMGAPGPPTM